MADVASEERDAIDPERVNALIGAFVSAAAASGCNLLETWQAARSLAEGTAVTIAAKADGKTNGEIMEMMAKGESPCITSRTGAHFRVVDAPAR